MTKKTYRQLKDELDEILAWFDQPDIDIEKAAEKHEAATKLLNELEELLKNSQLKIKKLSSK